MAQCKAHLKSGRQCKNQSIPGGAVCRYHGGGAPQVQQKARERLAALVDPAIDRLAKLIKDKYGNVALGAVKDVLDRAGYKPTEKIEQTNFTPEELEALENLSDDELTQYITLRRKVTQPRGSGGSPTPTPEK